MKEFYIIGKCLNSGQFGELRFCRHRETGSQRAVKILKKNHMSSDEKTMLFNEIENLKDLDHPNILKMYEFFEDAKRYYIVTDICKGGELYDEIKEKGSFEEKEAAVLISRVLSCVVYCHQNEIIH